MTSRILQIHQVGIKSVPLWLLHAWQLFLKSPLLWLIIIGTYSFMAMVTVSIPFVGIIFPIVNPILMAGMILGCAALDQNKPLKFGYLYSAFLHKSASKLATIGGLYCVALFSMMMLLSVLGQESLLNTPLLPTSDLSSPEAKQVTNTQEGSQFPFGVLFFLFVIFLNMAYWFAPLLTCFFNIRAKDALFLSFRACLKNIVPFFTLALILFGIALLFVFVLLLVFPVELAFKTMLFLGAPLFILLCVLIIYTSYKNIFTEIYLEEPPTEKD